jgi:hypothetical protein
MENKHQIEEYYFNKLKELYPNLPNGDVSRPEPPDFLIRTSSETIAVEITQIHNEKEHNQKFTPAQKHATEDQILKTAEHLFALSSGIPLYVRFHFSDNIALNAKQREILSEQICELIEVEVRDKELSERFSFSLNNCLPNGLLYVDGDYFPNVTDACWYSAKGRFVPNLTKREIINVINKKEKKMSNYFDRVDKAILVIAEGEIPNSWFADVETFGQDELVTQFEKVFIIRRLFGNLIEVK